MASERFTVSDDDLEHGCCHEAAIYDSEKEKSMVSGLVAEFFDKVLAEEVCAYLNREKA